MHYALNAEEYNELKVNLLLEWENHGGIPNRFVNYFRTQWVNSRFWRWQIFNSPIIGMANTNNPSEIINTKLKAPFGRKIQHMIDGLGKLGTFIETEYSSISKPIERHVRIPDNHMKKRAGVMIATGRLKCSWVERRPGVVCVMQKSGRQLTHIDTSTLSRVCAEA